LKSVEKAGRILVPLMLVIAGLVLTACGGDDEETTTAATTTEATTTAEGPTTEEGPTGSTAPSGSAGNPEARAKDIAGCLEGEGFGVIENPGNSELGTEANLVVDGGRAIVHVYGDEADASKNLATVEQAASGPAEFEQYGDVIVEVRTTSAYDEAMIEEARTGTSTCAG
jgi:hypothetical protein